MHDLFYILLCIIFGLCVLAVVAQDHNPDA